MMDRDFVWGRPVDPADVTPLPFDDDTDETIRERHERLVKERAHKVVYGGPFGILEGA